MMTVTPDHHHHHTPPVVAYLLTQWSRLAAPRWWPVPCGSGILLSVLKEIGAKTSWVKGHESK